MLAVQSAVQMLLSLWPPSLWLTVFIIEISRRVRYFKMDCYTLLHRMYFGVACVFGIVFIDPFSIVYSLLLTKMLPFNCKPLWILFKEGGLNTLNEINK